ncbi:MAG: hypothetical protein J6S85_12265 [Methanobrevibacter sp.]|nr:hypothetical protein [Methanobrevibacter sp.]
MENANCEVRFTSKGKVRNTCISRIKLEIIRTWIKPTGTPMTRTFDRYVHVQTPEEYKSLIVSVVDMLANRDMEKKNKALSSIQLDNINCDMDYTLYLSKDDDYYVAKADIESYFCELTPFITWDGFRGHRWVLDCGNDDKLYTVYVYKYNYFGDMEEARVAFMEVEAGTNIETLVEKTLWKFSELISPIQKNIPEIYLSLKAAEDHIHISSLIDKWIFRSGIFTDQGDGLSIEKVSEELGKYLSQ